MARWIHGAVRRFGARTIAGVLLVLAVVASSAFLDHPATGWNVNTRLALVLAVVDQGTFSIDAYHDTPPTETGDKAFFEDRFYSDKAIGLGLLALPVYAAMRFLAGEVSFHAVNYWTTLLAVSLPAGLALLAIWALLLRLGSDPWRGMLLLALFAWGSMFFGYSTVFMPYAPGIACVAGACWVALRGDGRRMSPGEAAAAGGLCGFAVIMDFLFGPMVLLAGVVFLHRLWSDGEGPGHWMSRIGLGALVGAIPIGVYAAYSYSIFGRPVVPYEYEYEEFFREAMSRGLFGIDGFRPAAAWFTSFHPYRGLFFWTPLALLAVVGTVPLLRAGTGENRVLALVSLLAFVAYFLVSSSYYMWWGGWSMGPRHLLPAFALLPLGLAWFAAPQARALWWFAVALGIAGVVLTLPISIVEPQLPQGNPTGLLLEADLRTRLAVPQFVVLQVFYGLEYFRYESGAWAARRLLRLGAAAAPAALLALAWWVLRIGKQEEPA